MHGFSAVENGILDKRLEDEAQNRAVKGWRRYVRRNRETAAEANPLNAQVELDEMQLLAQGNLLGGLLLEKHAQKRAEIMELRKALVIRRGCYGTRRCVRIAATVPITSTSRLYFHLRSLDSGERR